MIRNEQGQLVFKDGIVLEMSMPQIGIDPRGRTVSCGYDGSVLPGGDYRELTDTERRELADFMIDLWESYAQRGPERRFYEC